jgi:hypothetical protein
VPLSVVALNPKVQGGDSRGVSGFPRTDMLTTPTEKIHSGDYRLEGLNQWSNTSGSHSIIAILNVLSGLEFFSDNAMRKR